MRGFPNHLNTKQDFLNLLDDYPDETRAALQTLIDEKNQWLNTGLLGSDDKGITDGSHKVVEVENAAEEIERYQYEFKEDPNAKIFQLGFTVEEVQKLLAA